MPRRRLKSVTKLLSELEDLGRPGQATELRRVVRKVRGPLADYKRLLLLLAGWELPRRR